MCGGRGRKTLEAQGGLFRRVSFSLQTSLISPNFPARQPPGWLEKYSHVFRTAVAVQESFWADSEVRGFCRVRLRARFIGDRCFTTHSLETTRFHFWWMCLMEGALCRGVIRRERPACRSAPSSTNLNRFYPVAERAQANKSRWTGFGSEQPGIVARNMATLKPARQKERGKNPLS